MLKTTYFANDTQLPMPRLHIHFPGLDAVRSIACLFVLVSHTIEPVLEHFQIPTNMFGNTIRFFLNSGGTGVQIFFVLSGFLITYLLIAEERTSGKIHLGDFYMRRILRIWPMYFVTVIMALVIYPMLKQLIGQELPWQYVTWMHFTFLSNFDVYRVDTLFKGSDAGIVDVTWSVSIEEQFYLVWPVILILFVRWRIWALWILMGLVVLFQVLNVNDPLLNYYHTISCALNLFCGGSLALYLFESNGLQISKKLNIAVYAVFIILLILQPVALHYLVYRWLLLLFIMWILLDQNFNTQPLFRFAGWQPLLWLSKYTYSIYLMHSFVQLAVMQVFRLTHIEQTLPVDILLTTIIFSGSIVASMFTYNFIEKRFLNLKKKFSYA